MIESQIKARGLNDARLLAAFRMIPRHLFVPMEFQREAYADHPIPIGSGQTISQPYIVALMIDSLKLQSNERVLEIGTGSGYQTALLAQLALEVFSVERLPNLLLSAKERLEKLGCRNVKFNAGNGSLGWQEHAPYDAILVSASAPEIPKPLLRQLRDGGRMVLPIGEAHEQVLLQLERRPGGIIRRKELSGCVFVPLLGQQGWPINKGSDESI